MRFLRDGTEVPTGSVGPHTTLSLTVHFMNPPLPHSPAVRIRPHLLLRKGNQVEYEVAIWREDGEILGVGRQVALVRLFTKEVLERMRARFGRPLMFAVSPL